MAIKGFGGATLFSTNPDETANELENLLGLEFIKQEGELARYRSSATIGNTIDLKVTRNRPGQMGVGTVHHIAWRAEDDADQLDWKRLVAKHGFDVTPVQDRNYFHSIYFRERGQILFEIATDSPGFAIDESFETLGEKLKLPPQYERHRDQIERRLLPFQVRDLD